MVYYFRKQFIRTNVHITNLYQEILSVLIWRYRWSVILTVFCSNRIYRYTLQSEKKLRHFSDGIQMRFRESKCWYFDLHATQASLFIRTLQWRHNGRESVSNHQLHDLLLNRLFRRRSRKTKLRVTGLSAGKSPGIGEFPAQMSRIAEKFPFDDVTMGESDHKPALFTKYDCALFEPMMTKMTTKSQEVVSSLYHGWCTVYWCYRNMIRSNIGSGSEKCLWNAIPVRRQCRTVSYQSQETHEM